MPRLIWRSSPFFMAPCSLSLTIREDASRIECPPHHHAAMSMKFLQIFIATLRMLFMPAAFQHTKHGMASNVTHESVLSPPTYAASCKYSSGPPWIPPSVVEVPPLYVPPPPRSPVSNFSSDTKIISIINSFQLK